MTKQSKFPSGWDDEKRVKRVIEHYEIQSEDEAAEDEAAYEDPNQTFMEVPNELVPLVRELIAKKTELTPNA
jgi:hypothetical protein